MKESIQKVEIRLCYQIHEGFELFSAEELALFEAAREATRQSYAPYSKFNVGAALLLSDGSILKGSNQENAAYPSGLCAERVAMFYANSNFPNLAVRALAVTASKLGEFSLKPVPPCGSCRQVLLESESRFQTPIKIYLVGRDKVVVADSAKDLLPLNFDSQYL